MGLIPKYSRHLYEAADRIIDGEEERKIATSFRLKEPIMISLQSLSETLGVSKSEIVNEVLEAALTDFCGVLRETRPELVEVKTDPYESTNFMTPMEARQIRHRWGDAIQLDLEDAIDEVKPEEKKDEEE